MSIFQYPDLGYFNIVNMQNVELGTYEFPENADISLAHLKVYHKKSGPFSYQMRLVISQREGGAALVASNWETFSNETIGQTDTNWLGDLTFTFPDYAIKAADYYSIRLETTGYTRTSNSSYLGVLLDWGFGKSWIPSVGSAPSGGAKIALGVKL